MMHTVAELTNMKITNSLIPGHSLVFPVSNLTCFMLFYIIGQGISVVAAQRLPGGCGSIQLLIKFEKQDNMRPSMKHILSYI